MLLLHTHTITLHLSPSLTTFHEEISHHLSLSPSLTQYLYYHPSSLTTPPPGCRVHELCLRRPFITTWVSTVLHHRVPKCLVAMTTIQASHVSYTYTPSPSDLDTRSPSQSVSQPLYSRPQSTVSPSLVIYTSPIGVYIIGPPLTPVGHASLHRRMQCGLGVSVG